MATKVDKKAASTTATAPAKGAVVEVGTLHPERELVLAGRLVVLHEYGHAQGMRLAPLFKPFQDMLYSIVAASDAPPGFEVVTEVLDANPEVSMAMIAHSAVDRNLTRPEQNAQYQEFLEWMETLDDTDGYSLSMAWWLVNVNFFIKRVLRRAAGERHARRSAGPASTQPSSAPDTATPPTTLADTPPAS